MKDSKRALRRHHRQRMIARALRSLMVLCLPEEYRLQRALRLSNNLKWCSCYMCGNYRKYRGPTVQDLRQMCALKYDDRTDADSDCLPS